MSNDSRGRFDRATDRIADVVAHWGFFAGCLVLVGLWLVQGVFRIVTKGWASFTDGGFQLEINTTTTIITFLLLALQHNDQHRFELATNARLQDLMERVGAGDPVTDEGQRPGNNC